MRTSIRLRYTLIIVSVLIGILLAVTLFMNFGLESFVAKKKQNEIKESIKIIENCDRDGWNENDFLQLMRVATEENFGITVYDLSGVFARRIFSTNYNVDFIENRFLDYLNSKEIFVDSIIEEKNDYVIYKNYDERMGSSQIECMGRTYNSHAYVITTSMAGIKESADVAVQFLLYATIVGVVIAIILIYFICKNITKPIIQLADQSNKISNLDFTSRYNGDSGDEIGVLGKNMNKMSDHLETAIEDLRDANAKLEQDVAEKEKINKAQKEFLGNVSHELKTPIALIQGYAEGLKDGVATDPENAKYYTDVIVDEASKMNLIVKRLLNLDEIESGRLSPVMEEFNIVDVIKGVIESSAFLSKEKNVNVSVISPESILVVADEFMIEQAFLNYFSNACHHVNDNGEISVIISSEEDKTRVSVHNTGKNIPLEELGRIWDKFYKVDKAHTRSYGGSGIGLSLVKTIIDLHNGKVYVENTEDGVTFSFLL